MSAFDFTFPRFNGDALCADDSPDRWFPESINSGYWAKRTCERCDVRLECLAWAMVTEEPYGIWGGLSTEERKKLRDAA